MSGPKERLITSTIQLVCERGVAAMGLAELLSLSKASRNSLYQHFPHGKSELVEAAVRAAGAHMSAHLSSALTNTTPSRGVEQILADWKVRMRTSHYSMGCPIMAAALAEDEPAIQGAAQGVFNDFRDIFTAAFVRHGLPSPQAASLAGLVISAIEGAILQSRASKSTTPLDEAQTQLEALLQHQFASPGQAPDADR
jgi:TetR/AcrR family transcriptional repressor of lmrAB and yxaGH operons